MKQIKLNKEIVKCLDKQFPKGDKNRGKALVLQAIAHIELDKLQQTMNKKTNGHIYVNSKKDYLNITNALWKENDEHTPLNFKDICVVCGHITGQDSEKSITCDMHRAFQEGFKTCLEYNSTRDK